MPVVVAPDHVLHDVATGVWCGVTEASDELPARAEILATACVAAGAPIVEAVDHGLDSLLRVHDLQFLRVLQTAYQRWAAEGHLDPPGGIPYVTPTSSRRLRVHTVESEVAVRRPSVPRSGSTPWTR